MTSDRVSDERLAEITETVSAIVATGDCRIYDAESKVPLAFKLDTLLRALTELQQRRSVTVSDEMVERGLGAGWRGSVHSAPIDDDPDDRLCNAIRAALTAALVPAEQEGEVCQTCFGTGNEGLHSICRDCDDAPTPGGDNRVVAWGIPDGDGFISLTDDKTEASMWRVSFGSEVTALAPLSSLEAVERERDALEIKFTHWHQVAIKAGVEMAIDGELIYAETIARETAEASLAAAREALTPSGDTKAAYMGEFYFNFTIMEMDEDDEPYECQRAVTIPWDTIKEIMAAISARAALAGSNGE